jgi:hypothetical protein
VTLLDVADTALPMMQALPSCQCVDRTLSALLVSAKAPHAALCCMSSLARVLEAFRLLSPAKPLNSQLAETLCNPDALHIMTGTLRERLE